jgi:hypothetical protein
MSDEYNLACIMDIVRKIPENRIDDCLDEICNLVKNTSLMWHQSKKICADGGIEFTEDFVKLPNAIDWIDDGLGQVTAEIKITEDGDSVTVKTKL